MSTPGARVLARRLRQLLLAACAAGLAEGCAGYLVGNRSLYAPDVQTVYVPMIENGTLRRQLGERLTEAVVKAIELKTPYKVVGTPQADSMLSVVLLREGKQIVIESPTDEPRELAIDMHVQVDWLDRHGVPLGQSETIPLPAALAGVDQSVTFIPEVGQSVATAQQEAIDRLAEQIVSLMETPW